MYHKLMMLLLLTLLYIQAIISGIAIGFWFASRKTKTMPLDMNHITSIPPAIPNKEMTQPEKHVPKSTVSKFPNPELVRKQKDEDQLKGYLEDMRGKERPSGAFVL